jgi:hypothetical protein
MSVPQLSAEDRAAALARAAEARAHRREVREALSEGRLSVGDVLSSEDPFDRKMRVSALISAMPGYGPKRAAKLMRDCAISEERRVGGLGVRQREALLAKLG